MCRSLTSCYTHEDPYILWSGNTQRCIPEMCIRDRSTNFHIHIIPQQTEYDIKDLLIVSFIFRIIALRYSGCLLYTST